MLHTGEATAVRSPCAATYSSPGLAQLEKSPRSNKAQSKVEWSHSVVSDSLRPHGLQPTRLLRPWDFPGKRTGVGCHFLFQGIFPTQGLNPGLPHCRQTLYPLSHQGSLKKKINKFKNSKSESRSSRVWLFATPWTVAHQAPLSMGFFQARILELAAIPFPSGFSQPRDWTQVSHIAGRFFTIWTTKQTLNQKDSIDLFTWNGWIIWHVNYIPIKLV